MSALSVEKQVETILLEEILKEDEDLFLVEVSHKGNSGNSKLQVLIDGDQGLDIDRCARVSRQLGAQLEELDIIPGKYTLEVSSPGIDQPLKLKRQYVKNIGRSLKVELNDGEKKEGVLTAVEDEHFELEVMNKKEKVISTIALSDVKKSKVIVSFK
ncbi:MAG: ribosome maturation factor RimP [Cytophagales bacterium]|nr:ribosome maturation factor RimP [Cytophagales bacterium]